MGSTAIDDIIAAMKLGNISSFAAQFERLSLTSTPLRPICSLSTQRPSSKTQTSSRIPSRPFSSTSMRAGNWLLPTQPEKKRSRKGRPRVPTGGSARGTTLVWGDFGLRMCDHHRRVSAAQLKNGEEAIKIRLKGMRYRLYKRVCASIGVYSSGNEVWRHFLLEMSMELMRLGPYGKRKGFVRSLGIENCC